MGIRNDRIKYKKYRIDMKLAARYVADVINDDVPMGERVSILKEFLEDLESMIKKEVSIQLVK